MTGHEREEMFDLADGLGQLCIRGDEFETALCWGEKPVALMWNDNEGSIGQMLAHAGVLDASQPLRQMRRAADGLLDPNTPLWPQIYPLLHLFENGLYRLQDRQAGPAWDVIEHRGKATIDRFYPLDTLVMTQPSRDLARERILQFVDRIRQGAAPIVFCTRTQSACASFVVDGHHKLMAYAQCKVPPRILDIIRQEPIPASDALERSLFADPAGHRQLLAARTRMEGTHRRDG